MTAATGAEPTRSGQGSTGGADATESGSGDGARRVPFTLLGGYLGAGKTTLLNRLLASAADRRIVVLVNDVGAVNVDAALVAEHDGQTLRLTNGCVCCAFGDDLGQVLEQVRSMSPAPDHVVMELSGVGEPARLAAWANTTGFRLDGIVVVADADQIVELAERRYVGDTIRSQLGAADLVLLAKTDLAARPVRARQFVAELTDAPIHDVHQVDPRVVFGVGDGTLPTPTHGHAAHLVVSVESVAATDLSRDSLVTLVDGLGRDVVRAKGIVRCTDVAAPVEVHVVGRRRQLRERPDLSLRAVTDAIVVIAAPPEPAGG